MNHLLSDANVTLLGKDLYEATKEATQIVQDSTTTANLLYLSPYANIDVAAGAGTMMIEAAEDAGYFDKVIVPLGGGGLAASVGAWCSRRSPGTKVICTHPKAFGRSFESGRSLAEQLCRPTSASYSDGLSVQLIEPTPFAAILDSTIDQVIQVSETVTAASIAYLLRLQSLLVEGSAATAIGALVDEMDGLANCKGRILLLLTGGNVSSSTVAKALVADVNDPKARQKLGLRHIINSVERHGTVNVIGNGFKRTTHEMSTMQDIWRTMAIKLKRSTAKLRDRFDQKQQLAGQLGLLTDGWCVSIFQGMHRQLTVFIDELNDEIHSEQTDPQLDLWVIEERYRMLLQLQSALGLLFDRASAAYDQSQRDWFFDVGTQNATAVNYDRYGLADLRALELRFLEVLGLGQRPIELLLASSGMAAYQILQNYLLQRLDPDSVVVLPPYVYFEAMEQLKALPHIKIVHASNFSAEALIETAEEHNANAVFLDPIANIVGLPVTDIRRFAQLCCAREGWNDRYVVLDGTMASGAMAVYDWFVGPDAPIVLYYESASKYIQFGLDVQMGGLLVYPSELDMVMRTIRRNSGAIMYSRNASLLPPVEFSMYQTRMSLLTTNAESFRSGLEGALVDVAEICFPTHWYELGWRHGGALVTIRHLREGMNNKEGLEACIDLILRAAENEHVPMTKGVSFGFSTSRISSASSMAQDSDPFLRISVGVEGEHVRPLVTAVTSGILGYHATFANEQCI